METNLFVKNYKADGNVIKDISFYGDWEIDIGGGPVDVEYEYVGAIESPLLPYGVTMEKEHTDTTHLKITLHNNSDKDYYLRVMTTVGNSYFLAADTSISTTFTTRNDYSSNYFYLLSKDLKVIAGYVMDFS